MSSEVTDGFPFLDTLIGGWFHQDFDVGGNTLDQIIAAFKKVSPTADREGTKADIRRFLSTRDEAQAAGDFVAFFQPGVDPSGWGMTTKEWLSAIEALL